jgi:hypothetical protein
MPSFFEAVSVWVAEKNATTTAAPSISEWISYGDDGCSVYIRFMRSEKMLVLANYTTSVMTEEPQLSWYEIHESNHDDFEKVASLHGLAPVYEVNLDKEVEKMVKEKGYEESSTKCGWFVKTTPA